MEEGSPREQGSENSVFSEGHALAAHMEKTEEGDTFFSQGAHMGKCLAHKRLVAGVGGVKIISPD